MPNQGLVPTSEVAERLGVDVRTVHRMVAAGRLCPTIKTPGLRGAYMFDRETLDRDIAALSESAAS